MPRKAKSERKEKMVTMRLTAQDYAYFAALAEKNGVSVSEIICLRTKRESNGNLLTVARIQDVLSEAKDIAQTYAPEKVKELNGLEDAVWSTLS